MNKAEFIDAIADATGLSKVTAREVIGAVLQQISSTLAKGDQVSLTGFGTFKTRKRPARKGRNPKTGATIDIKAAIVPAFTAGTLLKEAVQEEK